MSDNVSTYGLVGVLKNKLNSDERDELFDKLEDNDLFVNYEGTLIFHRKFEGESYNVGLLWGKSEFGKKSKFVELCKSVGIEVEKSSVDLYYADWYNGCDSPMNTLTLAEYWEK